MNMTIWFRQHNEIYINIFFAHIIQKPAFKIESLTDGYIRRRCCCWWWRKEGRKTLACVNWLLGSSSIEKPLSFRISGGHCLMEKQQQQQQPRAVRLCWASFYRTNTSALHHSVRKFIYIYMMILIIWALGAHAEPTIRYYIYVYIYWNIIGANHHTYTRGSCCCWWSIYWSPLIIMAWWSLLFELCCSDFVEQCHHHISIYIKDNSIETHSIV